MAVELASAYVSIIPTTKGIQAGLEKELSPLTGVASKVGTDSGKALGSSFTGASGGLKSSMSEAEGSFSKFKSGATSALGSVGISTGLLAAGAGAAIIGFGVSAVNAFTTTAKAAIDMSAATGLSIEDASRWIAVGDDMGVSAETVTTGIGKISKTLDATKWAEFGVATRDAGGDARSTNDILLDTFDKLGKITNETDRAAAGNTLFGKGYAALAPMIGMTRAEMEKYLGSVEKGQVITASEAAAAEKARLAQDALSDAMKELSLSAGQLLAKLAPVIELMAKAVNVVVSLVDGYVNLVFATKSTAKEQGTLTKSIDTGTIGVGNMVQQFGELVKTHFNAQSAWDKTGYAIVYGTGLVDDQAESFRQFRNTFIGVAEESPAAAQKILDGYKAIKVAADHGDAAAKNLIESNGLEGDSLANLQAVVNGFTNDMKNGILTTAQQKKATDDAKVANDAAAVASLEYQKAVQALNSALQAEADLLKAQADALLAQADAMRAAADHNYALKDAGDAYNQHLTDLNKTIKDAKGNQDLINAAYRDGATLAAGVAGAAVQLAQDNATAAGATYTATQKQDTWNQTMLFAANQAGPAQRAEILLYIAQANGIPESKVTDIQALIDAGKFDEALALITDLSKARTADVVADAKTAQANNDLANLVKPREVAITAKFFGNVPANWGAAAGGGKDPKNPGGASGLRNAPPGLTPVGEHGIEFVNFRGGEDVYNPSDTRSLMSSWNAALMANTKGGTGTGSGSSISVGVINVNNGRTLEQEMRLLQAMYGRVNT